MKDLIKKILREDFDWAVETPSYEDMKITWEDHVLPYLTGQRPVYDDEGDILDFDRWPEISQGERDGLEPLAKHYFIRELNDIDYKDGKFMLSVSQWSDFVPMFKECDYQGYICQHTAEAILDENDHWEPYYDVVTDWVDQVWDSVDDKTYQAIVEHIRKHCIGDTLDMDGEEVELTNELLTSWLGEKYILGQMINEEVGSCFEDLKNSMRWAYEGAYNDATRDSYWNSTHEAIKGVVGESKWVSYEGKKRDGSPITRHNLEFDVSDIFMDVIRTYFDDYADLEYDHEIELEYSSFLDNLVLLMGEDLYDEPLNPSVSEWPDSDKVSEYMNERLRDDLG
jgi:hypothetical protein